MTDFGLFFKSKHTIASIKRSVIMKKVSLFFLTIFVSALCASAMDNNRERSKIRNAALDDVKKKYSHKKRFADVRIVKDAIAFQQSLLKNQKKYHFHKEEDQWMYPLFDDIKEIYNVFKTPTDPECQETIKGKYAKEISRISSKKFHHQNVSKNKQEDLSKKELALRTTNYVSMFMNEKILKDGNKRTAALASIAFLIKNGYRIHDDEMAHYLYLESKCIKKHVDVEKKSFRNRYSSQKCKIRLAKFLEKNMIKLKNFSNSDK